MKFVEEFKTHILCSIFFSKIAPFMRLCGTTWGSRTCHRRQCGNAHCMATNTHSEYVIITAFQQYLG